ncbi:MAG: DNA recombination protein RmuC [Deltaproteobacteria bacterium]|nr:DNA recombination protein RmuC [Deltaproteobacteria bacterium]
MSSVVAFVIGSLFGVSIALLIGRVKKRDTEALAQELVARAESEKIKDLESVIQRLKDSFEALASNALSNSTSELLKLANQTLKGNLQAGEKELENKKGLIDQTIDSVSKEMHKIQETIVSLEKATGQKFGELTSQLKSATEVSRGLHETTSQLKAALANTKVRGQWGERMAEDVLHLAGFIEGVNYQKQKVIESSERRPDYTFFLPQGLKINMDVKFPLNNYLSYLEAQNEGEKEKFKAQFLRDVRARIKEVTTRDYIDSASHTVDYVLVFIPNEQVYGFINEYDRTVEHDKRILDEALRNRVVLCSPLTLYAILAVIRQAIENFNLEQSATKILTILAAFKKQWVLFVESMDKVGKKIDEAKAEFTAMTTTRRSQLERPLKQIEDLRSAKNISMDLLPPHDGVDEDTP